MKACKKGLALVLSVFMVTGLASPVFAAEEPSPKEEVVYAMTDAYGTVDSVNVVNIFNGGDITDYGRYSSVKMLTTTDEIKQSDDRITFSTDAQRVYYQGTLKDAEIPWNISIRYFLDNKEYTAEEIAGKTGSLEIKISITRNSSCSGSYFDDYALQTTLVLDTGLCENIRADGATTANVGSDKQLLYTVLPGKGLETSVYADVKDFEMDAVSINGIKLNLDIDIDDKELTDKVGELMAATEKLNNGAASIYDGSAVLKKGGSSLITGASFMTGGMGDLNTGIMSLQNGMNSMQAGLDALNSKSDDLTAGSGQVNAALKTVQSGLSDVSVSADRLQGLVDASAKIKSGIDNLSDGIASLKKNLRYDQYKAAMANNGVDVDSLKNNNDKAIENCSAQIKSLNQTISILEKQEGCEAQVEQLQSQVSNLENIIALLKGNNAAIGGTESYLNNVSSGVDELYKGVTALQTEYEQFNNAISGLAGTLSDMLAEMSELKSGIDQLVTRYEKFDKGLNDYTDGVALIVSGYEQMTGGVSSLASGSKELLDGSEALSEGSSELYNGITALSDGAGKLNAGTEKLNSEASRMDTEIQDKIDGILSSIEGEQTKAQSFVSEKNTKVEDVQFVIKTSAIEKPEKETPVKKQKEETSWWQKFIRLFDF